MGGGWGFGEMGRWEVDMRVRGGKFRKKVMKIV